MNIVREEGESAEYREYVAKEDLRYQSFSAAGGKTAGHDRSYLLPLAFGDDIAGASVLDIGSYLGYFCVQALKRGAATATGMEPDAESVRHARKLAEFEGVAPRYLEGDFEEWDFGGERFDVVLCLNVLHHMFDAVGAINKIKRLARRRVILEFASPSPRDLLSRSLNPFAMVANLLPAIVLGEARHHTDIASRSFLFTAKAMRVLFDMHTAAFEPVEIRKSPFKGRQLLIARKRDLGHVAFLAGPTAAGKSTLFDRLLNDASCRSSVGLEGDGWRGVHTHDIDLPAGRSDRALVHYDVLRPFHRSIRAFNRDPRCDLLDVAEKTSVITLMSDPATLRRQLLSAAGAASPGALSKRHREIHERYGDPRFLRTWYESWFSYLQRYAGKMQVNRVLVRGADGSERLIDAAEWRGAYESLVGG